VGTIFTDTDTNMLHAGESRSLHVLDLARKLDRFGRRAEDFLCEQFAKLERETEEFEREKAAWRRQLKRESSQLERLRNELDQRQAEAAKAGEVPSQDAQAEQSQREAAEAALATGPAPFRLLLRPHDATSTQVGLFMFELSKLNREMGGRGLRFEIAEVRLPAKRRFRRAETATATAKVLELTGHSALPLAPRGTHVALDVDITDRIHDWIAFKTRLMQSGLIDPDVVAAFYSGSRVGDIDLCATIREASRRADDVGAQASGYSSISRFANTALDSIQQQLDRLKSCYESLNKSCGMQVHIDLNSPD